jgi:eukaryotic-like serine/threonine-protein kinase
MSQPDSVECPTPRDLERMLSDELPRDQATAVETHVATCPTCQAELERLTDTPSSVGIDLAVTRTGRPDGSTRPPHGPTPLPDVPGFQIECELGRGGMGVVFKARQLRLNRTGALKMILAGEFASTEVTTRFPAEAEIIARVSHPNIVQVFDFGDVTDRAYFAMEYVSGGTSAQRMNGKPWESRKAARPIEVVLSGAHQAHEVGVIHRDLKPADILLAPDGTPEIADFGVAKLTEGGDGLTITQALIGSTSYMPPEQADGRSAMFWPASDVHALGAVLYELLTGQKAFDGPTPSSVLEQVKRFDPPPPSRLAHDIPRDLETICQTCLEKDPHRRYASAAQLAEDL